MRLLNRMLLLGCVLLPVVGFSQLELEATGYLNYPLPHSDVFGSNAETTFPLPGLGFESRYGFDKGKRAVFHIGASYVAYSGYYRREGQAAVPDPAFGGNDRISLNVKPFLQTFGINLGFRFKLGSDKIQAIFFQTGFHPVFRTRVFSNIKGENGWVGFRDTGAFWIFDDLGGNEGMFFLPANFGLHMPIGKSSKWIAAPALLYAFMGDLNDNNTAFLYGSHPHFLSSAAASSGASNRL